MTIGLFLGRFQPFHLGHLDAVKQILKQCDKCIILVGSAQYKKTLENPFSYKEREQMIKTTLSKEKITKYEIIPIEDIHNYDLWVSHVNKIITEYDIVYTSNPITKELFTNANNIVKELKINIKISGTQLREMITKHKQEWKNFVSPSIIKLILNSENIN